VNIDGVQADIRCRNPAVHAMSSVYEALNPLILHDNNWALAVLPRRIIVATQQFAKACGGPLFLA
jgi:hypothetical protein